MLAGITQRDMVVAVDSNGNDLYKDDGSLYTVEKMEAHRQGILHRAVSVFIFNLNHELLLQKRAAEKYHSPEKWSNTCCTHPLPGEKPLVAARRRLAEEMGIVTPLTEAFTFVYEANVGNGMVEREVDHVFLGTFNQSPNPDTAEVSDWEWVKGEVLKLEIQNNPGKYSPWLVQCFNEVLKHGLVKC